jgi:exonuclease SbcC
MIIKSVRLKDFISHANTKVDFPYGITILVGPNGAGKTSILDAIVFALFGEKVRGDKVEDLIRRGCNSAEVEVVFEHNNQVYIVKLSREKKRVEAVLERQEFGIIATTASKVQEEISKIIEMDKATAIRSIIVRQGEIAGLIEEDPKERKKLFGRLLGIESLEEAWTNMKDLIEYFSKEAKDYDIKQTELRLINQNMANLINDFKELEKEIIEKEYELRQKSQKHEEVKKEVEDLKRREEEYQKLEKELIKVKEGKKKEIEYLNETRDKLKKARDAKIKADKLKPYVDKIPLLENLIRISDLIKNKSQTLKEKEKELERIQKYKLELSKMESAYNEYMKLEKEIEGLKKKVKDLEGLAVQKTAKETELNNLNKTLASYKGELERLKIEILKYLTDATTEEKRKKLEMLQKEKRETEDNISETQKIKGKLDGRKREIEEYLGILGESEICPVCKSKLTPEHREKVRKDFQDEIKNISSALEKLEDDLKRLVEKKERLEGEIGEIQKLNVERAEKLLKDINEYNSNIEKVAKELEELKPRVEELQNAKNKLRELEQRQTELKNDYERYTLAKRALEYERSEEEVSLELEKLEKEMNDLKMNYDQLIEKIGYLPSDPEKELNDLKKIEEDYNKLVIISSQIEELERIERQQEENIRKIEEKERAILDEIKKLDFSKEKLEYAESRLRQIENDVSRLDEAIKNKQMQKNKKEAEINLKKEEIERLEKEIERLEKIRKFVGDLETIRNAFSRDGVQKLIRRIATPIMSYYAREYLEKFNLDITDINISEDFDVSVIKGGEEIPISSLSGGEKVAVAIALRLAIAKVMAGKISTIIMDEPTTHLDEERRKELVEIMKGFFREEASIPQMILITHHSELEDVADTVYKVEKIGGISRVVGEY